MGLAARKMKITLPADLAIDAEVDLCTAEGAYSLQARLNVSLPGLERDVARPWSTPGPDLSVLQSHTRQRRRRDQGGLSRASRGSGLRVSIRRAISLGERPMSEHINHHRRGFLGVAA